MHVKTSMRTLTLTTMLLGATACGDTSPSYGTPGTEAEADAGSPDAGQGADDAGDGGVGAPGDATAPIDASAPEGELEVLEQPSGLLLRLDRVVYSSGDKVSVTLDFGAIDVRFDRVTVALTAVDSEDTEPMLLERTTGNRFESVSAMQFSERDATPDDGALSVAPGELFHALYFVDRSDPALRDLRADFITDFAVLASDEGPTTNVRAAAALSDDESAPPPGAKPVGTLVKDGGLPIQIATEELILFTHDESQLEAFLELSAGEVIGEQELDTVSGDDIAMAYLIAIDPDTAEPEHLPALLRLFNDEADIVASREDVLRIMELSLRYQAEGFVVAVNPRLQFQAAPSPAAGETVRRTMELTAAPTAASPCVPGVAGRECIGTVPALWAFTALWDGDERDINVAVLDMGFAPNADFRAPRDGSDPVQCDMTDMFGSGIQCGPGAAEGPPTVGNSFFGDRSWHGTGVVTTLGGVVNDGSGSSGVAGLNAVPMLYKFDTASYAFEMGTGILRAVADGASVINVSAGYPCSIITNFGPDLDICSPEGRFAICSVATAAVHSAAALTCATLGPATLGVACGVAFTAAAAETAACIAAVAVGDLKGPMSTAVTRAAREGVPVVTIAGNALRASSLPDVIRDYVDVSDPNTERWGIVPAIFPETIVVGAVDVDLEDNNLKNVHFYGDRVDIWAPIASTYFHPTDVDDPASMQTEGSIGGTSAAAPFITGVVAAMQALNPDLDPANPTLSRAERAGIVERIRGFLTAADSTFDDDELQDLGYPSDPKRRLVIDPLAAVRAATAEVLPDLSGYDDSVNFSELLLNDDNAAGARELLLGESLTGTIVHLPASGTVTPAPDQDWYRFTVPDMGAGLVRIHAQLEYPAGFGDLTLIVPESHPESIASPSPESAAVGRYFLGAPGEDILLRVAGLAGGDNVYKLSITELEPEAVRVRVLQPTADASVCANTALSLVAAADVAPFSRSIPDSAIEWFEGDTRLGAGRVLSRAFASGMHTVTARAYGDEDSSASVSFTAEACSSEPPTVTITIPATNPPPPNFYDPNVDGYDGYDDALGLWYVDLTVAGSAIDPEEGVLDGESLVWKTNRADLQEEELGTGTNPTIRIYSDSCVGNTHIIRLEARDSDGNVAEDVFELTIGALC